jgi:hypothetical protein
MGIDPTVLLGEPAGPPIESRLVAIRVLLEELVDELEQLAFSSGPLEEVHRARVDRAQTLAVSALELAPPV